MKIIVAQDLFLRPITINDAKDYFEFSSQKEVVKFLIHKPYQSIAESKEAIKNRFLKRDELGKLGIIKNKKLIGTCCLDKTQDGTSYNLSYSLNPQYWRQGITTKCVIVLLDYFFAHFPKSNVYVGAHPENYGSWKIIKKIGFQPSNIYLSPAEFKKCYPNLNVNHLIDSRPPEYVHNDASWKKYRSQYYKLVSF